MKFPSNLVLTTPRLLLRPFTIFDLEDFNTYASVPGVEEMAGWPHHQTLEESLQILQMFMADGNVLAIANRNDQRVIGSIGVYPANFANNPDIDKSKIIEIGYVLSKAYWDQALMVEAAKVVIHYLFKVERFAFISVGHFMENHQSQRVIEKLGFEYVCDGEYLARQLHRSFIKRKYLLSQKKYDLDN